MSIKDDKYSIIGELLLRILPTGKSNVSTKQNILSRYLSTTPKKQLFKDVWFIFAIITWFAFMYYVYTWMPELAAPKVTDPYTKITVSGNCTWIREQYQQIKEAKSGHTYKYPKDYIPTLPNATINIRYIPGNTTTITCPTVTTATTTTLVCPDCVCTCPQCETQAYTGISRATTRAMINIRPGPNNSPAYSGGCYDCLEQAWSMAGIPVCEKTNPDKGYCIPRFRGGVETGYWQSLTNKTKKETCTIDFIDIDCDGKFPMNTSIWAILGNGSIKTIYRMD